jgi:hypothetical protein
LATFDTGRWLGSIEGDPKDFIVIVFVPSQTRDGKPVDHDGWRQETLQVMAQLFQGATAVEGSGAWRDDDRGGAIKEERISAVYSLMAEADWNERTASTLGQFLRRMGREANQGEVGIIVNGEYFPIREFGK